MICIDIPGVGEKRINHLVFDFNGTIARDGVLIPGVQSEMNRWADQVTLHVITADTFGFVKRELTGIECILTVIPEKDQARSKLNYIIGLDPDQTLCVGNGANDEWMLRAAAIGIAVMQTEGAAVSALMAADLAVRDILDVFGLLKHPRRLSASLRR